MRIYQGKMSKKDQLITFSYQKKKNPIPSTSGKTVKKEAGTQPSTSVKNDLKVLKDFDLQCELGPCIGISRLERWKRAEKHGLNPSPVVRDVILEHQDDPKYTECLWNDYKNII